LYQTGKGNRPNGILGSVKILAIISNERQSRITKAALERFEQALANDSVVPIQLDPRLQQAMREGIESQAKELREQLAEYDAFRSQPGHQSDG
jgi:hypothetical protein